MDHSMYKLGFWASLLQSIVGYLYLVFYIIFIVVYPPVAWVDIQSFAQQDHGWYSIILSSIQVLAFFQSFLFFVIAAILNHAVSPKNKLKASIGLGCSLIFLALSSIHYFIQLISVRNGISKGLIEGLEHFAQFNFDSPISVINIMGWTFFCGIACLAFSYCFENTRKGKALRIGFLINGIASVITAVVFACGQTGIMLLWTASISLTWYVYPILTTCFKQKNLDMLA